MYARCSVHGNCIMYNNGADVFGLVHEYTNYDSHINTQFNNEYGRYHVTLCQPVGKLF